MGESRFHQSEQELFESVRSGIMRFTATDQPQLRQFNEAAARIYGFASKDEFAEALENDQVKLVYFYDRDMARNCMEHCMETGKRTHFGHRIKRKDGSIGYLVGSYQLVDGPDTQPFLQAVFAESGSRVMQEDVRRSLFYVPASQEDARDVVLLASPDVIQRKVLQTALGSTYALVEARSLQEADTVFDKESERLAGVLVDGSLAVDVMERMRSNIMLAAVPVLVVGDDPQHEERYLSYGANDYLTIPVNVNVLRLRLAKLIELRDTAVQRNAIETLVDNLPGGVIVFQGAAPYKLLYASNNIPKLTGLADKEARSERGVNPLAGVYEKDRERVAAEIEQAVAAGNPLEVTFRLRQADGALVWIHAHGVQVRVEGGVPIYQAVLSPTTSRERMFSTMLDDAFCAIAVNDARTDEQLYANAAARAFLQAGEGGVDSAALPAVPWACFKDCQLDYERYQSQQATLQDSRRHLIMNGRLMDWSGIQARVVYATEDTESYLVQNDRLETALREAERANAAKSEFLSRMSHDIRTPMNAVLGMARLALDEVDAGLIRKYLAQICESGEYLLGLINDILDMSKIESDHVELYCEPCSVRECIGFVQSSMRSQLVEKRISFSYQEEGPTDQAILADRMRLQQVFFNLISNAVKFTEPGGSVAVTAQATAAEQPDMVRYRITVADDGVGIDQENLERIFDPFEQVPDTTISRGAGTGLGLAIVRNLVQLMSGTVTAASTQGKGTRFIVEIPFNLTGDALDDQPGPILADTPIDFAGKRVLLVEDHPVNMEIAQRMLEKTGCQVEKAPNGKVALDLLEASEPNRFDAVLMDIRMPEMGGLEASRRIRQMDRQDMRRVPIVAMTANAFAEDVRKSLDAGMTAHLAKPIKVDKLYATLQGIWS